jgi:hypothetical protein
MKKILFFSILIGAVMLVACDPPVVDDPEKSVESELNADTCCAMLMAYYPYSLNEEFIFENKELGKTWETKAYEHKKGEYPDVNVSYKTTMNDATGEISRTGAWHVNIDAPIIEKDWTTKLLYDPTYVMVDIGYRPKYKDKRNDSLYVRMWWDIHVRPNAEELYSGGVETSCDTKKLLDFLTDTITFPLKNQRVNGKSGAAPAGSYVRLVKDQGLTDFCIDGKTVWRRVK